MPRFSEQEPARHLSLEGRGQKRRGRGLFLHAGWLGKQQNNKGGANRDAMLVDRRLPSSLSQPVEPVPVFVLSLCYLCAISLAISREED